jgi:hypothetical protein
MNGNRTLAGAAQMARWRGLALREDTWGAGLAKRRLWKADAQKAPVSRGPLGRWLRHLTTRGAGVVFGPILGTISPFTLQLVCGLAACLGLNPCAQGSPATSQGNRRSSIPRCSTPCQEFRRPFWAKPLRTRVRKSFRNVYGQVTRTSF